MDGVLDYYLARNYPSKIYVADDINEIYWHQKHNVALTLAGAFRLLADGLFIQSGVLLRTAIESSLVLLEVAINPSCIDLLAANKYRSQSVLKRIRAMVPQNVIGWYGYLSANFSHVAAIHQAPYIPRSCYPDNWIIVTGLQNILRSIVAYHILLERVYLDDIYEANFWIKMEKQVLFKEDSRIFKWADQLGKDINVALPTENPPAGVRLAKRYVTLKESKNHN